MNYSLTLKIISIMILVISLLEIILSFIFFVSDIYIDKYVSEMTESVLIEEDVDSIMDEFGYDDDEDWDNDALKAIYGSFLEHTNKKEVSFFDFIKLLRGVVVTMGGFTLLIGLIGVITAIMGILPPGIKRLNYAFCFGIILAAANVAFAVYQRIIDKTGIVVVFELVCVLVYLICIHKIKKQVKSEEKLIENADGLEEVVDIIE